ncbi:MAG: histidine kinase [Bacteroidia bacterium]
MQKNDYRFGFFILLIISCSSLWANHPIYDFRLQELPPQQTGQCLLQDENGFVWLGGKGSIARFDGFQFEQKYLPDSAALTLVKTLIQIQADSFWVGTSSGSVFSFRPSLNKWRWLHSFPGELRSLHTISSDILIASVKDQGLWLYQNKQEWVPYQGAFADQLNDIYQIANGPDQQAVCATDYGLFLLDFSLRGTLIPILSPLLSGQIVRSVTDDHESGWWIGTFDQGVFHISYEGKLSHSNEKWSWGEVVSLAVVGQELWIGTHRNGLLIMQKDKKTYPIEQFANDNIQQITYGQDGILWILSTQNGLAYTIPAFSFLPLAETGIIASLIDDRDLWYSTTQGLFRYRLDSLSSENLSFPSASPPICLYKDRWKQLWIGTQGDGLWRYQIGTKKWDHYDEAKGLINNHILSIAGAEREIWLATFGGAEKLSLDHKGEIASNTKIGAEGGLGINYLYQVLPDSNGKIWFATDGKGLRVLGENKVDILSGTEKKTVLQMTKSLQGDLYFAVSGEGLNAWDGQELQHYGKNQGLRDANILTLKSDPLGRVVCLHKAGLDLFSPISQQFLPFDFPKEWGSWAGSLQIISQNHDQTLWIPTEAGLLIYKAHLMLKNVGPEVVVPRISLFQKVFDAPNSDPVIFGPEQNHISFPVHGRWFPAPRALSYAYRLHPIDLDWSSSRDQQITYPNLAPGSYELFVKPCFDTHCLERELVQKKFTILKPIWEKPWFAILMIALALGIFLLIQKKREADLSKKEQMKQAYTKVQFELLKSQVNPHFLFNSFNTLAAIIEKDPPTGIIYLDQLSDLFRAILSNKDQNVITIEDELEILDNFYALQRYRHRDNFQLNISLPIETYEKGIPPLTLQMLVENALKHNVVSTKHPLLVQISLDPGGYLKISNPLQKRKPDIDSTGLGLLNIRERYQALTNKEVRVEITQREFAVFLPILNQIKA